MVKYIAFTILFLATLSAPAAENELLKDIAKQLPSESSNSIAAGYCELILEKINSSKLITVTLSGKDFTISGIELATEINSENHFQNISRWNRFESIDIERQIYRFVQFIKPTIGKPFLSEVRLTVTNRKKNPVAITIRHFHSQERDLTAAKLEAKLLDLDIRTVADCKIP